MRGDWIRRAVVGVAVAAGYVICQAVDYAPAVLATPLAAPARANGGTYRGMTDTGSPMLVIVGADGLSIQRLAFGAQLAGGAPPPAPGMTITVGNPPPAPPGQPARTPFLTVSCLASGRPMRVSDFNDEVPLAGVPVDGEAFWASGGSQIVWTAAGSFDGEMASGTYALSVDTCGQTTVNWTAQRQ